MFPWGALTNPYWLSAVACGALALALNFYLTRDRHLLDLSREAKRRLTSHHVARVTATAFLFRSGSRAVPDVLLDTSSGSIVTLRLKEHAAQSERPQPESQPEPQPKPVAHAEVVREPEAEPGAEPEAEAEAGPEAEPEAERGVDREREIEPEVEPVSEPETATQCARRALSINIPHTPPPFSKDDYDETVLASVDNIRILEHGLHFANGRALSIAVGPQQDETTLHFQSRAATEAFVDAVYHARGDQTSRPENLSLFLTTFNVGNSQPANDLSPWLGMANGADIVAIGAQECSYTASASPGPMLRDRSSWNSTHSEGSLMKDPLVDTVTESSPLLEAEGSSSDALVRSSSSNVGRSASPQTSGSTSGKEHWQELIASHFAEEEYACITKQSAWDRCLTIFVKRELLPAVSRVRHDTANVGLGGVAGNKGAIGTRFSVFDTDFVVINSHLAAHHKEVNRRNEDYTSIANGLHALRDSNDVDVLASNIHHVFWMGDLNYRINLERDEVLNLVKEGSWKPLQEADQLLQEMAAGRAFQGFKEGETNFPPTYRYEYGSRNYSAVKLRIPSYCDRILYRSLPGCKLDLKEYKPADEILTSDHSPVYALFTASLVHTSGMRSIDKLAEIGGPAVRDQGVIASAISPRALAVRSLLPGSLPGFAESSGVQLMFKSLAVKDIPDMHRGGRRVAVAKALNIHSHLSLKKHEDLGPGQHADPYCMFHGDAVAELDEGVYRTRTIDASQNPVWEADSIPSIDLISTDMNVLRRRYVIVTVKDEEIGRRDDTVGSAVLWLGAGELSGSGTVELPVSFSMPIMQGGRQQGEVSGSYIIRKT